MAVVSFCLVIIVEMRSGRISGKFTEHVSKLF